MRNSRNGSRENDYDVMTKTDFTRPRAAAGGQTYGILSTCGVPRTRIFAEVYF